MLGDQVDRTGGGRPISLVGITGNSGCGQSTAAGFASDMCAGVCSLDEIGHRLLEKRYIVSLLAESLCRNDLRTLRGPDLRKELGRTAFSDAGVLEAINSVLHPRMQGIVRLAASAARKAPGIRVLEGALLIELGLAPLMDRLIVVRDSLERCSARVAARDSVALEETSRRWRSQLPIDDKASMADWVVDNSGSKDDMRTSIVSIFASMNRPGPEGRP